MHVAVTSLTSDTVTELINNELALHFSLAHAHFIFGASSNDARVHMQRGRKKITERQRLPLTRVNLPVTAHSIRIHNVLEARGKFIGPYQGRGSVVGGDTIDKGRNCSSASSLKYQSQIKMLP